MWLAVARRRRPAITSIPPSAIAMAPTPAVAAISDPVNANDPPDVPLLPLTDAAVPALAETTVIAVEALSPMLLPVPTIV
jgi:hypothetical protein